MAAAKPARGAPAPITVEQMEAAARAKIVAQSVERQRHRDAMEAAAVRPVSDEAAKVLAAFDRLERGHRPTPDEQASLQAERQRQESMARSVAAGYSEWTPALDEHGQARLAELQAARRREV